MSILKNASFYCEFILSFASFYYEYLLIFASFSFLLYFPNIFLTAAESQMIGR